jgi:CO/xanthine dehydrogenase Mo-binding subunit
MSEEVNRPWLWKVPEDGAIGKHVHMKDGYEKASGRGTYTRDIYRPGMLYAKFIRSPYTHAKIKSMDITKAKAFPGVWDIITYDDPDLVWFAKTTRAGSEFLTLDPYSVPNAANWHGQPLGIIAVAESEEVCDRALALIKIEWEPLPFILDPEEALKPGAPVLFPEITPGTNLRRKRVLTYGEIEKGFQEADQVTEFKMNHDEISWAGTEGVVAVADWKGDKLEVWHHCQDPDSHGQNPLEKYTTANKINVHAVLQGGIFGSITHLSVAEAVTMLAALAAKRTHRPVKVLYDQSHFHGLEEEFGSHYFKIGFKKNGKITAVQVNSFDINCMHWPIDKVWEGTAIPNIQSIESTAHVNRGGSGPQRAGGLQCSVVTMIFEHVAGELGIDPTKIAEINDGCEGKDMAWINENVKKAQGFDASRDSLKEVLEVGKKAIDWDRKWHLPGTKKLPNGKYHGIGCTWIEAWTHYNHSSKKIGMVLRHDGTINILARRAETGTHGTTTYPQIVADEIGMRYEDVYWASQDDSGFDAAPVGNSSGLLWNVPALARSSRKMKLQILEHAVKPIVFPQIGLKVNPLFPGKKPEELDLHNSEIFEKAHPDNRKPVKALAQFFSTQIFAWDSAIRNEEQKYIMTRQAYFLEVEVDPDTGEIDIKKVVIARDCGKVINPDSCDQQLYGVYQGLGRSCNEVVYHDPRTGVKLNDNLIDYPQYTMNDIESIDIQKIETGLGYGPYGLVGLGESSACCTDALSGPAIYNAIGKYVDSFPTTPDKVLRALGKI